MIIHETWENQESNYARGDWGPWYPIREFSRREEALEYETEMIHDFKHLRFRIIHRLVVEDVVE